MRMYMRAYTHKQTNNTHTCAHTHTYAHMHTHSHPVFRAEPSIRDIENQENYQHLFRDRENEPFVGFIVGAFVCKVERKVIECTPMGRERESLCVRACVCICV